jgi:hypothetical protein
LPNQRPEEYPHSGQEKTDAAALATVPVYGAVLMCSVPAV